MIIVRLLSPEPVGWYQHHQLYSGAGADIVMESMTLKTPIAEGRTDGASLRLEVEVWVKHFQAGALGTCTCLFRTLFTASRRRKGSFLPLRHKSKASHSPQRARDTQRYRCGWGSNSIA